VPILFHSGCLTIDRSWTVPETSDGEIADAEHFYFRLPSTEVKSSCNAFLFQTIFDYSTAKYDSFRQEFLEALAKRNSEQTAVLFTNIFSGVYYYHIPGEHFYRALINASLGPRG
jgi:hypothetical protein